MWGVEKFASDRAFARRGDEKDKLEDSPSRADP